MEIRKPVPPKVQCVGCAKQFYYVDRMRCGECDFLHRFLTPMLKRFAPGAEVKRTPTGVVATIRAAGAVRSMPFFTEGFELSPETVDLCAAQTYERVRRLVEPDFRFDWTLER